MAYTTQAKIEGMLGRSLTSSEQVNLDSLLANVDSYINEQVGTSYGSVTAESRYYNGSGITVQEIEPCTDITVVAIVDSGETTVYEYVDGTDYEAFPRNEDRKFWLESRIGAFPIGVANIMITAKFHGGDEVPNDIDFLATYLASKYFKNNIDLESESIEGHSEVFKKFEIEDEVVSSILDRYKTYDVL